MDTVTTVLGEVNADSLGRVLPHEHIASVYGRWGKQIDHPEPAWEETVFEHYLPMFVELRECFGCQTIVECSPSYAFRQVRDLEVWAELSRQSGVNIVVSTGFYIPGYRPADFSDRSISQLADGMIHEAMVGMEDTGVRAGIIKVALGDFGSDDRKLLKAAAVTQRETGLTITTHVCSPEIRRGTLDLLEGAGVSPERITLGHADDNATLPELLALVQRGCNVLLTIWGIQNMQRIGWRLPALPKFHSPGLVAGLVAEGLVDQVMVSIDYSGGFEEGEFVQDLYDVPGRTHLYLFTHVLHTLAKMGVPEEAVERILCDNPRRMLVAGS